ncbi:MAG: universal stress protein [Mariprofundus sp.]
MIKHNKILVPTDGSDQSTEAIRRAGVMAEKFGSEVHLLYVMKPSMYFEMDMVSVPPMDEVENTVQRDVFRRIKAQVASFDFKVVVHMKESAGDPARSICQFAESLPADLIVIARHAETSTFAHMLMGSFVERVVAHAPCSVMVTVPNGLPGEKE